MQRCRQHKIENVVGYLPQELKDELKCVMKAAYRLSATDGIARLQAQAHAACLAVVRLATIRLITSIRNRSRSDMVTSFTPSGVQSGCCHGVTLSQISSG